VYNVDDNNDTGYYAIITTGQSNLAKAASNVSNVPISYSGKNFTPLPLPIVESEPHLMLCTKGLHPARISTPKQDLKSVQLFLHSTAVWHRQTDVHHTCYSIIMMHFVYSMWPNNNHHHCYIIIIIIIITVYKQSPTHIQLPRSSTYLYTRWCQLPKGPRLLTTQLPSQSICLNKQQWQRQQQIYTCTLPSCSLEYDDKTFEW